MKVLQIEIVSVQTRSVKLTFHECGRYICVTIELILEWQIFYSSVDEIEKFPHRNDSF